MNIVEWYNDKLFRQPKDLKTALHDLQGQLRAFRDYHNNPRTNPGDDIVNADQIIDSYFVPLPKGTILWHATLTPADDWVYKRNTWLSTSFDKNKARDILDNSSNSRVYYIKICVDGYGVMGMPCKTDRLFDEDEILLSKNLDISIVNPPDTDCDRMYSCV